MGTQLPSKWINRDISWLSFNERVLQEAEDKRNPLIERMRFLGIFSNNRDEFFRVRVAAIKRVVDFEKDPEFPTGEDPKEIMDRILKTVIKQQQRFDKVYSELIKELQREDIYFLDEQQISGEHVKFVQDYFRDRVRTALIPIMIDKNGEFPFLKDAESYLFVRLSNSDDKKKKDFQYAVIEVPTDSVSRITQLPSIWKKKFLMLLDDVIRYNLPEVFSLFEYDQIEAYNIKMTRDAELDIDDDISKSLVDKLSKSVKNRSIGEPVRFVYDAQMPDDMLKFISKKLGLEKRDNLIPGGRYHNFKDFIDFPEIGARRLRNISLPPVPHPRLEGARSIMDEISKGDVMLNYPYQKFTYVIDFLRQAAIDPNVTTIRINLYRVARDSKIINALSNAVKNGKDVQVLIELRARFDEKNNIKWSKFLEDEGVKVHFGLPGLKVHSKLILVQRKERGGIVNYAHVGTGNFHEKTAKIYSDMSLLTCDKRVAGDVEKVFEFINRPYINKRFSHLVISPFATRSTFVKLLEFEMEQAKKGKTAWAIIKLNNLNDPELIKKLYQASCAGVKIKLIIRGICSLVPGIKDLSENISVISIVDRFLEHTRVYAFCNAGKPKYYIGSADWLVRNLDKRVEVTTPIYDPEIQKEIQDFLDLQLADNVKARIISERSTNKYVKKKKPKDKDIRSQIETYKYFANKVQ